MCRVKSLACHFVPKNLQQMAKLISYLEAKFTSENLNIDSFDSVSLNKRLSLSAGWPTMFSIKRHRRKSKPAEKCWIQYSWFF